MENQLPLFFRSRDGFHFYRDGHDQPVHRDIGSAGPCVFNRARSAPCLIRCRKPVFCQITSIRFIDIEGLPAACLSDIGLRISDTFSLSRTSRAVGCGEIYNFYFDPASTWFFHGNTFSPGLEVYRDKNSVVHYMGLVGKWMFFGIGVKSCYPSGPVMGIYRGSDSRRAFIWNRNDYPFISAHPGKIFP